MFHRQGSVCENSLLLVSFNSLLFSVCHMVFIGNFYACVQSFCLSQSFVEYGLSVWSSVEIWSYPGSWVRSGLVSGLVFSQELQSQLYCQ